MERLMTRIVLLAAGVALLATACSGATGSGGVPADANDDGAVTSVAPTTASVENPVPATEFILFDGQTATLATYAGSPLVVNFWASWCPSCVAEMSAAFRPVQEEVGAKVVFLGMNIQDRRSAALALLDETGVQWISAEDPTGALYTELGGLGMPFTIFVSVSGDIVETHNGPLSESQLRDRITELFGV
jgi:thiol-disulfide isomerase/thioredoxin